ncbi:MAG: site-specific integrase, partial [Deltaproteobacteria bacterium]
DRKIITIPRSKHGQVRYITMHSLVVEHLLALADGATSEWVFPSQTGKTPLGAQNFVNRVYNPSVARAEIDDFHFHDLRHTFASRLVMSGVGLYTVKELMGHRTIEMTMRYSHLSSGHLQEAVERLALPRT